MSRAALSDVAALPAHAMLEAHATLTRLPHGLVVAPDVAAIALARAFPEATLRLDDDARAGLLAQLADADVHAGPTYDALVALEASAAGQVLLTRDRRAQRTYRRLGVAFTVVGDR